MQTMPASGAEEFPVAQDGGIMAGLVLAGDSHRAVDLGAQLAAIVPERLGQGRDAGWPALGLLEKGLDEPVTRRPGCEDHVPRLDVGV